MPNPWKKARLGGISRLLVSGLRSNAKRGVGDSPLVVQAGFPTSVADLVVKNRTRLRKPPRWRRPPRPGGGGGDAGCSIMATLASEIIAAAAADRLPTPPRSPPPEVDKQRQRSPIAEKGGDLESLIGADLPNKETLHGLLGSKVSKDDGPRALPTVPKALKVEGFEGLHGSKATKDGVNQGIPGSKAEKDEFFQASARPKVPKTEPLEGSPTARARKGEVCRATSVPEEAEREVPEGGNSGGFMVVAKVAFLMVILVVVSKKIAVVISILAFAILFAESIGKRLIPLLGPCDEAKKSLGAIVGSVPVPDLIQTPGESNSNSCGGIPILLASIGEPDLGSFHSGRNRVMEGPVNAAAPTVEMTSPALEEKDSVKVEGCRGDQEASTADRKKKKKKKLFKNFVPIKFRGTKGVKGGKMEGKLEPASDSNGGEAPGQKGVGEEALEEEEEDGGGVDNENKDGEEEGRLGLQTLAKAHDAGLEDAAFVGEKVGEPAKGSSGHLVFFVIILSGLIGGRVVALLLTVLWYSLVSSARSLWRSWNSHRSLAAVSDASTSEALSTGGVA